MYFKHSVPLRNSHLKDKPYVKVWWSINIGEFSDKNEIPKVIILWEKNLMFLVHRIQVRGLLLIVPRATFLSLLYNDTLKQHSWIFLAILTLMWHLTFAKQSLMYNHLYVEISHLFTGISSFSDIHWVSAYCVPAWALSLRSSWSSWKACWAKRCCVH